MINKDKDQPMEKPQPVKKKKKKKRGAAAEKNNKRFEAGFPAIFLGIFLVKIGWILMFINPKHYEDNIIKDST